MLVQPIPLAELATSLRCGERDLTETIEAILSRIDEVDPQVQALVPEPDRRQRVLKDAQALQQRYPDPANRPLLYGVPLGVKDIFRVDGLPTGAGSTLPPKLFRAAEASCVSILKQHGALVIGKTVTTEFAFSEPGPTRNPHNLDHTPGGSSSGSAAGVSAGLFSLAIGTQTVGSVIRPAAYCGVVGYKPSYGRIDPTGVIFFAQSLDHVGLFTPDVEGMMLAASVLCRDWQPLSDGDQLPTLGVPDGPYLDQASPEGLTAFEQQIEQVKAAGYTVVRVSALDDINEIAYRHRQLMAYELAKNHTDWFAEFETRYRPATADIIREGQEVDRLAAQAAVSGQEMVRRDLETRMADEHIDIWISPGATGPAPEGIASTGNFFMNLPWTHAGLPTVTVPAGTAENGLPLGLQCASRFESDEQLLRWAVGIEQVFKM